MAAVSMGQERSVNTEIVLNRELMLKPWQFLSTKEKDHFQALATKAFSESNPPLTFNMPKVQLMPQASQSFACNVDFDKEIVVRPLPYRLPLKEKEMPASFAGQALRWAANTDLLNPPNLGQGRVSKNLGKPLRFIGRLVYGLVVPFFAALAGIGYHLAAATGNGIKSVFTSDFAKKEYLKEMAKANLEAAWQELPVLITLGSWSPVSDEYGGMSALAFASNSADVARLVASHFNDRRIEETGGKHQAFVFEELLKRA